MQNFQDYRDESYMKGLWKEVWYSAEQCNVERDPIPVRKTKQSSRLDGHNAVPLGECSEHTKDTLMADYSTLSLITC